MAESKASWYETGYSGAEREQEKRALGAAPPRFWLKPAATKDILFVDDTPFCYKEHSWRVGEDKQFYYATCTNGINAEGCHGDSAKGVSKADYIGQLTIVDITGYVSRKDNKEHKFEVTLFSPKTKVLNKLKLRKEKKGTLVNQIYTVTRGDENSPNTGDDFDWQREVKSVEELFKVVTYKGVRIAEMIEKVNNGDAEAAKIRKYLSHHFMIPDQGEIPLRVPTFNYSNLFAPLSNADMRQQMAGAHSFNSGKDSGGGKGSGGGAQSEDIPF